MSVTANDEPRKIGRYRRLLNWIRDPMHRWRKYENFLLDSLLEQAQDDREKRFFNTDFVARLDQSADQIRSKYDRLILIGYVLYAVLLASVYHVSIKLALPTYNLPLDTLAREVVLLASASIGARATALSLHSQFLRKAATALRSKQIPEAFSLSMLDRFGTQLFYSEMGNAIVKHSIFKMRSAYINVALIFLSYILFVVHGLCFLGLKLFIHIKIMVDIWLHPSLDTWLSHSIVVYCAAIDALMLGYYIFIAVIPLRYLDKKTTERFLDLRAKSDTDSTLFLQDMYEKLLKAASSRKT